MIVKVESNNGNFKRLDDCMTACFTYDTIAPESTDPYRWVLICTYANGKDNTYPLSDKDAVYFMNNDGKTIDKFYV